MVLIVELFHSICDVSICRLFEDEFWVCVFFYRNDGVMYHPTGTIDCYRVAVKDCRYWSRRMRMARMICASIVTEIMPNLAVFVSFCPAAGISSSSSVPEGREPRLHQGPHRQLVSRRPAAQLQRPSRHAAGLYRYGERRDSAASPLSVSHVSFRE